jgi:hypothetical protein
MPIELNPGEELIWVREDDMALRLKGEFIPNDRESEVDSAGCRRGDLVWLGWVVAE